MSKKAKAAQAKKAAKGAAPAKGAKRKGTTNRNGITHGVGEDVGDVDADHVITAAVTKDSNVELRGQFLYIDGNLVGSKGQVKAAVNRLFRRARRSDE